MDPCYSRPGLCVDVVFCVVLHLNPRAAWQVAELEGGIQESAANAVEQAKAAATATTQLQATARQLQEQHTKCPLSVWLDGWVDGMDAGWADWLLSLIHI